MFIFARLSGKSLFEYFVLHNNSGCAIHFLVECTTALFFESNIFLKAIAIEQNITPLYQILCRDCDTVYVGETGRSIETKMFMFEKVELKCVVKIPRVVLTINNKKICYCQYLLGHACTIIYSKPYVATAKCI